LLFSASDTVPVVRIEPRYQYVDEGTEAVFRCVADGNPAPRIEWYRGSNQELNPRATVSNDGILRIPNVRRDDESDYYCKATNNVGTSEMRTLLYVTPGKGHNWYFSAVLRLWLSFFNL